MFKVPNVVTCAVRKGTEEKSLLQHSDPFSGVSRPIWRFIEYFINVLCLICFFYGHIWWSILPICKIEQCKRTCFNFEAFLHLVLRFNGWHMWTFYPFCGVSHPILSLMGQCVGNPFYWCFMFDMWDKVLLFWYLSTWHWRITDSQEGRRVKRNVLKDPS